MAVVKLVLDDIELELGSEGLRNILSMRDFDETQASDFVMRLLETSKSADVKAVIAHWFKLPAEAVRMLLNEDIYQVTDSLVSNKRAVEHIPHDWFCQLIKSKNAALIVDLFDRLEYMPQIDRDEVVALMAEHSDPTVRKVVAGYSQTKLDLLKHLKTDEDAEVREVAGKTLHEWEMLFNASNLSIDDED